MAALMPLRPKFYQSVGKPTVNCSAEELTQFKNLYFLTDFGIINLLGSLPPIGDFEIVASHAQTIELFEMKCLVISIEDLITVKNYVGRPKDKAVEVELRAIQE